MSNVHHRHCSVITCNTPVFDLNSLYLLPCSYLFLLVTAVFFSYDLLLSSLVFGIDCLILAFFGFSFSALVFEKWILPVLILLFSWDGKLRKTF